MESGKQAEFAKATAVCVELALNSVEGDIRRELEVSTGAAAEALRRLLLKVNERQKTIEEFTGKSVAA